MSDSKIINIAPSLEILNGVHTRWAQLLKVLSAADLEKVFIHPEHNIEFTIKENILIYAWHCNHHLAHITALKKEKNW